MPKGALAAFLDLAPREEGFRDSVLGGLARRPKKIPCRFLYDARGSALFDEICKLPEYYLTRTEIGILDLYAGEIAERIGPDCQLIEFGSGSSRKVRILLDALERPAAYMAIDISRDSLCEAAAELAADFPLLPVTAVCADYMQPLNLPELPARSTGRRIGFFPGSTIGNLTEAEAVEFLAGCRELVGADGAVVVGVDLKKDPAELNAAYNDAACVSAAFNLNLLERINRELDGDFDLARFAHAAAYNEAAGCVRIHIRSLTDQTVTIAGRAIPFAAGELIHTEDSYKYTIAEFHRLAARAGFRAVDSWTDRNALFSVHFLSVQ